MPLYLSHVSTPNTSSSMKRRSRSERSKPNMSRRNAVAYNQNLCCINVQNGLTPHPLAYEGSY